MFWGDSLVIEVGSHLSTTLVVRTYFQNVLPHFFVIYEVLIFHL